MTEPSMESRMLVHARPCHLEENPAMHMARKLDQFEWTLEELDRLPDDGNKYELVRGELFVTPAPTPAHERIAVVLSDILVDYVRAEKLGRVFHPRAVVRFQGSEVEPDIMVRPWTERAAANWAELPVPLLVVEILSGITRLRDPGPKKVFYRDVGIPTYWIVDGKARTVRVIEPSRDVVVADVLTWHPTGASSPLVFDVQAVFREALGE